MYCMYLRKSRADLTAEARGEGETLARHEHLLQDTAVRLNLEVGAIYRELLSGESIRNRPVMKRLLSEVEAGMWEGVLVVEIERLARGDTQDQGVVTKTFKYSHTLIVTPSKVYDPNDEFDEEYFEFGLFMSRREYKTINRRMRRGVVQAVRDGCWPYNRAPYGYTIARLPDRSGFTLSVNPHEAAIYRRLILAAAYGTSSASSGNSPAASPARRLGDTLNARYLNDLGLPTRSGKPWTAATVYSIRTNPVQTGKVVYGRRSHVKTIRDGEITKTRPRNTAPEIHPGLHPPLIDETIWKDAQRPFIKQPAD